MGEKFQVSRQIPETSEAFTVTECFLAGWVAKELRTPLKWAGALPVSDAHRLEAACQPALSFSVPHSTGNVILTRVPSLLHGVPQCLSELLCSPVDS